MSLIKKDKKLKYIVFIPAIFLALQFFSNASAISGRDVKDERAFESRQSKALKEAEELFLSGDYRGAARACEDIIYLAAKYPSRTRYLDKIYYFAGVSCLKLNELEKTKLYLERMIADYKRSSLLPDAYLALAEAYFLDEDYGNASELLLHFTRTYPRNPSIPQACLRLWQISQREGRWEEAKLYFDRIKKDFPLSFEAELLPPEMDENSFFFTVQLGSFNNLDNARKLKEKMEEKGQFSYVEEVKSPDSTFYRVRVGKFKTRAEAKALADKLEKEGLDVKVYP